MDRDRRGVFIVRHTPEWAGGLEITATDDSTAVRLMLDRLQVLTLIGGLFNWWHGTARVWQQRLPRRVVRCRHCDGLGFTVVE